MSKLDNTWGRGTTGWSRHSRNTWGVLDMWIVNNTWG
jgi:hypothetical protein